MQENELPVTHAKPNSLSNHAGYIAWKDWSEEKFGLYTKSDQIEFACELQRANVNLTSTTRVLEIGFGNGAFAGWVRQFTTHYIGTEANQELVDRALKAGIAARPATLDIASIAPGQFYNVIVALDVLEHLKYEDIITLLKACRTCISKDGVMLLRVPSGDSPFSGTLFNGDITHKTLLGSKAFAQLAVLTGFEIISTHDTVLPIFGLGLRKAVERAMVKFARKLTTLFIRVTFLGNKHAVITSNMIVILRSHLD